MRTICRGPSPQPVDFDDYAKAQPILLSRLGAYCSYCERRIPTSLAVEHIQPKGLAAYAHLAGAWINFLLACVNCNSTKKDKDVVLADVLLPDRDHTFAAFEYVKDGRVRPSPAVTAAGLEDMARRTLALTGLERRISEVFDQNGKLVAIDRVSQRMEVWAIALEAKADVDADPGNAAVKRGAVRTAKGYGFFSIWMAVFSGNVDMCNLLIEAFPGTRDSRCFDPVTATVVCPASNPDGLVDGAKF
ncbi:MULTISPECIES: HNH endonuclease [unclassified Rhizobacter]|uniref:HNH endonuclease n=1 Tax=unclassified Rhizobacter TaxID=2640088 RepID=UPI0006F2B6F6|nr:MULTISPECIES: HNH endonuclease [unclassified Rhizobacter]KQU67193.1 HNH endonuclease [Rhizobacter sp. Root29]KQV98096.1 HNH endonuclease [Rhizobacter sp. Root1238]KRB01994.1 HNH endonuclease [Rhizobacter sp. Root16D2]